MIAFKPGPGASTLAFWCDDVAEWDRFKRFCEDGTLTYDGQHVEPAIDEASDRDDLFIRFRLAAPYRPPPLVLVFEDIRVAVTIGETGWYSFDGGLYRAEHRGGGRVYLDRVFESSPPEIYFGRALHDPPAVLDPLDAGIRDN